MLEQEKNDWDFKGADTKYATHGIHYYPARMIPQIANRLISNYSQPNDLILDPFCGSGTVLLECKLLNRNAIGFDINPLAYLLSNVKMSPLKKDDSDFKNSFFKKMNSKIAEEELNRFLPKFENLKYWFTEKTIRELLTIKYLLFKENLPRNILKILQICFSKTIQEVSKGVFNGSSTHLKKNLENFSPNVFDIFEKNVSNTLEKINNLNKLDIIVYAFALPCDSRNIPLRNNSIDCIITSPPYGEEQNTIGYMRWTKFSLYWLGYTQNELLLLKKKTLGANTINKTLARSKYLSDYIKNLEISERRIQYIKSFFFDYSICLKEMFRVLKTNTYCCIVIGNRTIAKKPLFLDKISIELAIDIGFRHINTFYRNIPAKVIPWAGISGKTIKRENIIILKKV